MLDYVKVFININFTEADKCTLATRHSISFPRKYALKNLRIKAYGICILLTNGPENIVNR